MKITNVTAYAIKLPPIDADEGAINIDSYGDYFIANDAWTSIYSRSHETCLVSLIATAYPEPIDGVFELY